MQKNVELLQYFGNDFMVCDVARVSHGKEAKNYTEEQNKKLIKYLWEHQHTSPFRHPQIQFRITCPIYVERQLFTHQVGIAKNCLHGDTLIRFKNDSGGNADISIRELWYKWTFGRPHQQSLRDSLYTQKRIQKKKCRVLNEITQVFEIGHIKNVYKSGVKKLFKITLQNGQFIICTAQHKIYTKNGWLSIEQGLSSKDFVGCNGIKYIGTGEYRDKDKLLEIKNKYGNLKDMAKHFNCSTHNIRKWLKIHKIQFKQPSFPKGHIPWNKGIKGYKLNLSNEARSKRSQNSLKNNPRGENSRLWKGGITTERALIAVWTTKQAKKVHEKFHYTCQKCGGNKDLEAHHIIPVVQDISLAYTFDNLISVCQMCHDEIHKSLENERNFALMVLSTDYISKIKKFKPRNNRIGPKLKVHWSKIVSIQYHGEDETYDIEMFGPNHNFIANNIIVHNSISGRYVDFSDSYTKIIEGNWRGNPANIKQGSGLPIDDIHIQSQCSLIENEVIELAKKAYNQLLKYGVCKEQARTILPLNLNTQFIWTNSLQAFGHLCSLRLKPNAQEETRNIVNKMLQLVKEIPGNPFQHSLSAFGY